LRRFAKSGFCRNQEPCQQQRQKAWQEFENEIWWNFFS
jgi:hypothetical protein